MKTQSYSQDFYQALMRIGFLASDNANFSVADKIFLALSQSKPEKEGPVLALAYNAILEGHFEKAIEILKNKALKINPGSEMANTYMGMALGCLGKKEEADKLLQEVIQKGTEPASMNLAKRMQEQLSSATA